MKKVLFVMKNMSVGGVEKSLLSLLDTLSPLEYEVDLLLLEDKGEFRNFIPSWVNVDILEDYQLIKSKVNENPKEVILSTLKRKEILDSVLLLIFYIISKIFKNFKYYYMIVFRNVKKREGKYDIAIAYSSLINYITWYVVFCVNAKKRIGWIHFDIEKINFDKRLFLYLHKKIDKIYVVSKQAYEVFCNAFPLLTEKAEIRYNIIDENCIRKLAEENIIKTNKENNLTIVTLGRLEIEKGQDIIPEIANSLRQKNIKFKWYIVGDGSLRTSIKNNIIKYGLTQEIELVGTVTNPYPYLKIADIYVQTSVHEGFCITLGEAKVFEPYIVSTNFTGAKDQLTGYDKCKIVHRNVDDISKAIIEHCM